MGYYVLNKPKNTIKPSRLRGNPLLSHFRGRGRGRVGGRVRGRREGEGRGGERERGQGGEEGDRVGHLRGGVGVGEGALIISHLIPK